jgi:antitoxin CptB
MGDSIKLSKIRWRCRRGTKELDYLLLSYFDQYYLESSESKKSCFEQILLLQDPVLIEMFADPNQIENKDYQQIVIQIVGTEEGFLIR